MPVLNRVSAYRLRSATYLPIYGCGGAEGVSDEVAGAIESDGTVGLELAVVLSTRISEIFVPLGFSESATIRIR